MTKDAELLQEYARTRSEAAFAELVRRHLGLVYSVALRQCRGDVHRAQDVAQQVFVDLASKAGRLAHHPVLGGWLHRSARLAALDAMRRESRRTRRELEAHLMNQPSPPPESCDLDAFSPLLDDAIAELDARDRDAVTLRFFENRPFAEVGARLRLTENAARMRVERALDKLQGLLARRGITSTAAALGAALAQQATLAAPAGLAASVVSTAVSTTATTVTLVPFLAMAKVQSAIAAAVILAGLAGLAIQQGTNARLESDLAGLQAEGRELVRLEREIRQLTLAAEEVDRTRAEVARLPFLQSFANAAQGRPAADPGQLAAALAGPVFDPADLDQQPVPTLQGTPAYPVTLRRAGTVGEVRVGFVIKANGTIADLEIVSATHPEFVEHALNAVSKWKYRAGRKAGAAVNSRTTEVVTFDPAKARTENAGSSGWFPP